MNLPGVIGRDAEAMQKLEAARSLGKIVDGHAPGAEGETLDAYIAAGISTDHECTCPEEAEEKAAKGLYVHLREGTGGAQRRRQLPRCDGCQSAAVFVLHG